jgi:LmbE family N-acetylglucosaminyl deacetylase
MHFGGRVRAFKEAGVLALLVAAWAAPAFAQFPPAPGTGPGLAETVEAIENARVATRILYVDAHPDDESSAILTYLARGLHADVALLSLTRGEGGQNALGPEQAPQLGLIRTQELLGATRGYGVKLYFTRAKDFGYSKTAEETERIWGDTVLEDMVRVIREFRPNIVINNWGGVHGGHGHHQTSGLWTPKAVELAADPNYLRSDPEARYPWNGGASPVVILDRARGSDHANVYFLPVDEVSSLWGKTWREIGLDAFVNHRTQGIPAFINSPFLRGPLGLVREDGKVLEPAIFAEGIAETAGEKNGPCSCGKQMKKVEDTLAKARQDALNLDWDASVKELTEAEEELHQASMLAVPYPIPPMLYDTLDFLGREKTKIDRALRLAAGIEIDAEADRGDVVAGESFHVSESGRCRQGIECKMEGVELTSDHLQKAEKEKQNPGKTEWTVLLKETASPATRQGLQTYEYPPADTYLAPEPLPLVNVVQEMEVEGFSFAMTVPAMHVAATSTRVDKVPLRMVPAYTLAVDPEQTIEKLEDRHGPFEVLLRVHSYSTKVGSVSVGVDVPTGWTASAPVEASFDGTGDRYAKLTVTPPATLTAGNYTLTAYAKRDGEKFSELLEPLPSMPTLSWEEPAECVVHAFDISVPERLRVGYITAEHEPVPDALKLLGIQVEMLNPEALAFSDLSKYDAIVVGVRAYELRSDLPGANQRLLNYVSSGGTLVVQYQRDFAWDKFQYAPYAARIEPENRKEPHPLPRITDENSPVRFLKLEDPLLNAPNKITQEDFKGWVQERGLYFWSQFDPRYTALLEMNDPGESELDGGLVYTKYGKGTYIYTGIAFFRQFPAGVPGAYRLFVNLLSASRAH